MATTIYEDEVWASINSYDGSTPMLTDTVPSGGSFKGASRWQQFLGYVLFFVMGVSPQLLQNGLFMETAVFRERLPEGSAISAAIVTSFMASNIIVLLYLIIHSIRPLRILVWLIFILCAIVGILVAFLWDQTVEIGSDRWSFALLALSFTAGLAGNTSTLVFFAFASNYIPILTTALSAGYGASSGLAAVITLLEHVIPGFNVMAYFLILEAGILIGLVAYLLVSDSLLGRSLKNHVENSEEDFYSNNTRAYSAVQLEDGDAILSLDGKTGTAPQDATNMELFRRSGFAIFNMVWISAITFFMPGLIPYITDEKFKTTFLNGIFLIAPPLGASISGFLPFRKVAFSNVVLTAIFVYILLPCLAVLSGVVPTNIWALYVLMALFALLSGYNTTMIYLLPRDDIEPRYMDKVSRWIAMANQVGATIGTVATDIVIAVHVLKTNSL